MCQAHITHFSVIHPKRFEIRESFEMFKAGVAHQSFVET